MMVSDDNAVVQYYRLLRQPDRLVADPHGLNKQLCTIRRKHIMELNDELAAGMRVGPGDDTEELAILNLSAARELKLREPDIRKCAQTLLKLAGTGGRRIHLDPELVSESLELFRPTRLGKLGYDVCMQTGQTLADILHRVANPMEVRAHAIEFSERAVQWTESLRGLCEWERTMLRAEALAQVGSILFNTGDRASGQAKLEEALALLHGDVVAHEADAARAKVHILRDLSNILAEGGDTARAIQRLGEAVACGAQIASGSECGPPDCPAPGS